MSRAAFDINTFWLYAVLLHITGSIVFSGLGLGSYASSMLMNLLMLLLMFYVCRQRRVSLWEYCALRWIPVKQWGVLLLLTFALIIIASYINALSMLFFRNLTAVSLQHAGESLIPTLLVFALLPAVTEEILFRGYIFRGIVGKKTAVAVSALLFALLHMNFNQMSYAFVMGLFFALLIWKTNNLAVTMVVHLLFNSYNIMIMAFASSPIVRVLANVKFVGYSLLTPSFQAAAGGCDWKILAIGTGITGAVLLVALGCMNILQKMNPDTVEDILIGEGKPWNPDRVFLAGLVACLAVAVSYEILL